MAYRVRLVLFFSLGVIGCVSERIGWSDSPVVPVDSPRQLVGIYTVAGTDNYGNYRGSASIDLTQDASAAWIIWRIADLAWTGEVTVKPDGALHIKYTGAYSGSGEYTYHADGSLHGSWSSTDSDRFGRESLHPLAD